MITAVTQHLIDRKILAATGNCPANVFIGRTLILLFFPDNAEPVAAKVARSGSDDVESLKREYDALSTQHRRYPGLAPVPIAFETTETFCCLAMQKMSIRPVRLNDIAHATPTSVDNFVNFLVGRDRADGALADPALSVTEAMSMLPDGIRRDIAEIAGDDAWRNLVTNLDRVPQHCDLAINNAGLNGDDVAVFDWEDYGTVNAAGFDFFVLLMSSFAFDYRQFSAYALGNLVDQNAGHWAARISAEIGVTQENVFDFAGIFALIFYGIKRKHGYGQEVQAQILEFLKQYMADRPAQQNDA